MRKQLYFRVPLGKIVIFRICWKAQVTLMYRPLADEIRPQTLDEVVGQTHILGPDGMLRRLCGEGMRRL